MKFTSLLVCSLLLLTLAGCSSAPAQKADKVLTDAQPALPGASVLPAGPVTANPYVQHKPAVSASLTQSFTAATQAMGNKQWAQAQRLLESIVAADTKLSGAHLNLALTYSAQGQTAAAEASLRAAINANPNNLDAYNQLAIIKREAGDFAAAEQLYWAALKHWGFHSASHRNLAILYDLYLNKPALALPHYQAYLQLTGGTDKQALSWIADLERRLGVPPKPKAAAQAPTPAEVNDE